MEILVKRKWFTEHSTAGELYVDGNLQCYTMEDVVREPGAAKVYGETAIPTGRYMIEMLFWQKHGKDYPHIMNVPGFEGILIHGGNTDKDSEGCILIGMAKIGPGLISGSKPACDALFPKIEQSLAKHEGVWITVENDRVAV